jgi:sortase A
MTQLHDLDINQQQLIKLYRRALVEQGTFEDLQQRVHKKLTRMVVANHKEAEHDQDKAQSLAHSLPKAVRVGANFLPVTLIVVGMLLLGSAVMPVVSFYAKNITQVSQQELIAPIPEENVLAATPLVVAQAAEGESLGQDLRQFHSGPVIVDADLDYTNLSNWFEGEDPADLEKRTSALSQHTGQYLIDIPKVDVNDAVVKIGGTNLDESLIQYPGTSLPGKPGAPVVFGHSLLRQFYNPKKSNPRRYNSIFSTIMTLEKGDKIYVEYNQVRYTYMVQSKKEVKPTDTFILSQDYSGRHLKLVTCVPEGTYLRRGVVTAQLVKE